MHRDHHAGAAESTLGPVLGSKGRLQLTVRRAATANAFNGGDGPAIHGTEWAQALMGQRRMECGCTEFTEMLVVLWVEESKREIITTQAPHPPSPQERFVPLIDKI